MEGDMLKYLQGAITLEKQSYTQQGTIQGLDKKIRSLGQKSSFIWKLLKNQNSRIL